MAKKIIDTNTLTNIANAIREKTETTAPILVSDFASTIATISGGSTLTIVDALPTPTEAVYYEGNIYLTGNDLYYCGREAVSEPVVSNVGNMPTARRNTSAVAIGTNAYIFGGYDGTTYYNTIYKYDSVSNVCTQLTTTLPFKNGSSSAVLIGTNAYIFGGRLEGGSQSIDIFKYDSVNNTCTNLSAKLPNRSEKHSAAVVGTSAYIFGGYFYKTTTGTSNYWKTILKFDATSETITTLSATLPTELSGTSATAIGTNIYIFGGGERTGATKDTILKFNTTTNALTTLSATLPSATSNLSSITLGTNAYIFKGNEIYKFDSTTETCTTLSTVLPNTIFDKSSVSIGDNAYIFGGTVSSTAVSTITKVAFGYNYKFNKIAINEGSSGSGGSAF